MRTMQTTAEGEISAFEQQKEDLQKRVTQLEKELKESLRFKVRSRGNFNSLSLKKGDRKREREERE